MYNLLRKMSRSLKIFSMFGLLIFFSSMNQCALKFYIPPPLFVTGAPDAIFRDDFPFRLSEKTPDVSLALPPARKGNSVLLLPAGQMGFEMRYYLMENAQKSIKIQTYILYSDPVSKKIINILLEKQKQGVEVILIADCYTKFIPKDRALYFKTEKQGLEILGYEPIYFSGADENGFLNVDEYNFRFHEKYIVVDDWYGITGGSNISQEYALYENKPRNMWRDQDVLIVGPTASDMARAVEEDEIYFRNKEMDRPELVNPKWWQEQLGKNKKQVPAKADNAGAGENAQSRIRIEKFDDEDVMVRLIRTRPRYEEDYVYQAYLHLINTAQKRIILEIAYFVPDEDLLNAILNARKRGVAVTLITNNAWTNDVFEMHPYIRYFYLPMMQAGAEIYEWQGIVKNKGSLHSKCAIFDDDITVIGSYNIDPRGRYLNSEDVVVIKSEKVASSLKNIIDQSVMPYTEKITMDKAKFWHNPTTLSGWLKLKFSKLLKDWW